jgi:amino acid transporter
MGVPYLCLTVASLFCALAYLNVSSGGVQTFAYLTSTVTIFGGLIWVSILFSHIRFMAGFKAQGISRDSLPYKAPLQPWASPIALFLVIIVLIFKGFAAFLPSFQYKSFITNYIGFPVYFLMWIAWKLVKKTKFISAAEIDFSGAKAFDVLDEEEEEKGKVASMLKKTTNWIRRKDE